jgi:hypothetical protein
MEKEMIPKMDFGTAMIKGMSDFQYHSKVKCKPQFCKRHWTELVDRYNKNQKRIKRQLIKDGKMSEDDI